jgi:UDP-glucose 4-epimerase
LSVWLLTGGAGYIGAHVLRALQHAGHYVVVLDDLSTGLRSRVPVSVPFVHASVADLVTVREVLRGHGVDGVIHLAAKKAVGESCEDPLYYYEENLGGLIAVLSAMRQARVHRFVYSSSAAVYGTPDAAVVDEQSPTRPESPYGRSKLMGEWIVADSAAAYDMSAVCLRYFNVVGSAGPALADVGGSNLFPSILDRLGDGVPVSVFGGDYPTPDGTCVRDYVHVEDLASAHVAAAALTGRPAQAAPPGTRGVELVNVGCGRGFSVLEVLDEFAKASGNQVPYVVGSRRPGDPPSMVARAERAGEILGWSPSHGLQDMVASAWTAHVASNSVSPCASH